MGTVKIKKLSVLKIRNVNSIQIVIVMPIIIDRSKMCVTLVVNVPKCGF